MELAAQKMEAAADGLKQSAQGRATLGGPGHDPGLPLNK
jgi:hypothetical protein